MSALFVRFRKVQIRRFWTLSSQTLLLGLALTACDQASKIEELDAEGERVESIDSFLSNQIQVISLQGKLSIRVTPVNPLFAPCVLPELSALPNHLTIELQPIIKTSGTVNLALDPASDALPVAAEVWATHEEGKGLLPIVADEDPFSKELFLLSLGNREAKLSETTLGSLTWIKSRYRFDMMPSEYPPFHRSVRVNERLALNLPPLNTLHLQRGRILIDPYTLQPLSGATLIVTQDFQRISLPVQSDGEGRFELAWWTGNLSFNPIVITIIPAIESGLPIGRYQLDPQTETAFNRPGTFEDLAPVSLPQLDPRTRIQIGIEGDDEALWHAHLTQLWPQSVIKGDPIDPQSASRRDPLEVNLRVAGLWESQSILSSQELGEIWLYPKEAVLTLRPPVEHPSRTTRIELSEIGGDLSIAPVLKQKVLGQVTKQSGEALEGIELYALQRAWPWQDVPHLPLGERWSFTLDGGKIDVALDPGQYALRLRDPVGELAPKVILSDVLELGDVTLDSALVTLDSGSVFRIRIITPDGTFTQAQVELFCELDPPSPSLVEDSALSESYWTAFHSLQRAQPKAPSRIRLAQGLLDEHGIWSTLLSPQSCPSAR